MGPGVAPPGRLWVLLNNEAEAVKGKGGRYERASSGLWLCGHTGRCHRLARCSEANSRRRSTQDSLVKSLQLSWMKLLGVCWHQ